MCCSGYQKEEGGNIQGEECEESGNLDGSNFGLGEDLILMRRKRERHHAYCTTANIPRQMRNCSICVESVRGKVRAEKKRALSSSRGEKERHKLGPEKSRAGVELH